MKWLVYLRKTLVSVVGGACIIAGLAMIFLPGPAFIFIPLGVAILSLEFAWAKRMLEWMKRKIGEWRSKRDSDSKR